MQLKLNKPTNLIKGRQNDQITNISLSINIVSLSIKINPRFYFFNFFFSRMEGILEIWLN